MTGRGRKVVLDSAHEPEAAIRQAAVIRSRSIVPVRRLVLIAADVVVIRFVGELDAAPHGNSSPRAYDEASLSSASHGGGIGELALALVQAPVHCGTLL